MITITIQAPQGLLKILSSFAESQWLQWLGKTQIPRLATKYGAHNGRTVETRSRRYRTPDRGDAMKPSFVKRYKILEVLSWTVTLDDLSMGTLLIDLAAIDDKCPAEIRESEWQGEYEIQGDEIVVTVYQGE